MNHFLLSGHRPNNLPLVLTDSGRYGVHAMEQLINEMLRLGAQRRNLRAKAFGGATVIPVASADNPGVGELNCQFVRQFLAQERIPLVAEDLGGIHGRVIYFVPEEFSVLVRKIPKSNNNAVARQERALQRQTRDCTPGSVQLFD